MKIVPITTPEHSHVVVFSCSRIEGETRECRDFLVDSYRQGLLFETMVAVTRKSIVKNASGSCQEKALDLRVGGRRSPKRPLLDPAAEMRIVAGRAKAADKRRMASETKKANNGMTSLGSVINDDELKHVQEWLVSRPHMISFVSLMMRSGKMEKIYSDQLCKVAPCTASQIGKRLLGDVATRPRWRHLANTSCALILSKILPDQLGVACWFKGEEKLSMALAGKALMYALGVTPNTPLPSGHKYCQYMVPLLWLCKKRWAELGNRLSTTTKISLDSDSDYWVLKLEDRKASVVCNPTSTVVEFMFEMSLASDWVITDPESYISARLVSQDAAMDPLLARAYEKENLPPTFDDDFHFPEITSENQAELTWDDEPCNTAQAKADALAATARGSGSRRPAVAEVQLPP